MTSTSDIFTPNLKESSSDSTPSPTGLAWDGTNLYVTDSLNYRVLVFTPANSTVPVNGVVNSASRAIYAQGSISIAGTITVNLANVILIQIQPGDGHAKYVITTTPWSQRTRSIRLRPISRILLIPV